MSWHDRPVAEILAEIGTDPERGLSSDEARRRLEEHGRNEIRKGREISALRILIEQFNDFLIYVLLAAAVLSVAVGFLPGHQPEYTEAILILAIVLANGAFGFAQDYRAERAMEALRELSTPETRLLRDGKKIKVPADEIVPGDIVLIEPGDRIPADLRLIESQNLETMEAGLTGESGNVSKSVEPVEADTPLAERSNLLFMQTDAVRGRAKAVVVATGMGTEVGAIASEIAQAPERKTSFQEELDVLGKRIGAAVAVLIVVVAAVQYFLTAAGVVTTLMVAITLAVAAVPEGLPAIVTLTLALGSSRMAKQKALARRLSVVESLGSVDVIITDKTGTLTDNQMTVQRLYFSGQIYEVTGQGTEPEGEFRHDEQKIEPSFLHPLLFCGATVNDAEPLDGARGEYHGDPTEVALLVSAAKAGIEPDRERLREVPFSSDRKRMTVVVGGESSPIAYVKGAPEVVLDRSDRVLMEERVQPLSAELREQIVDRNTKLAESAYRVLGFASKEVSDPTADEEQLESGLVFLGLQAMIDPPRAEVRGAVDDCRRAGIRVIMVTGDNLATAKAVGREIGFDPESAMTGADLEKLSADELSEAAGRVEVFARVSPHHKVRLLRALQGQGHRVAMTGDGVNDAPALRSADVGVAMGVRGTEVAKEASDMVLQDDNFVTLRNAIAEGRSIFDNIRKFVIFLLSANAGEILIVFVGVLIGSTLLGELFAAQREAVILTPVMLLWINLVTDGLPALALGVDPEAKGIMERAPRARDEPVINQQVAFSVAGIGVAMTLIGLPLFFHILQAEQALVPAQTVLFTFVVIAEMAVIQLIRSRYGLSTGSNPWLLAAVASSLMLQALVLYTPLSRLFGVIQITAVGWLWTAVALAGFVALTAAGRRIYARVCAES